MTPRRSHLQGAKRGDVISQPEFCCPHPRQAHREFSKRAFQFDRIQLIARCDPRQENDEADH